MDIVEDKFINTFQNLLPNYAGEPILVAVSGGIDSMVCAHIFKKYKYPITIAHCNFQLRKKDSDNDAVFVKKWAAKNEVPFLMKKFDVKKEKGKSTQMQARDLRYEWFNELFKKDNFQYIVTAHHLNDSIETSLMNMIRGTGIQGLTGIPEMNGHIVRPMIHIFKSEIEQYAQKEKLNWREDKSNKTDKYKRNKIRHQLIPMLEEFNPNFLQVYANNMYNWHSTAQVFKQAVARLRTELIHYEEALEGFKISVLELMSRGVNSEILFELIAQFGFNASQCEQILEAIDNQPGKKFFSKDHILLIDRLFLIIKPIEENIERASSFQFENNFPFENDDWKLELVKASEIKTLKIGRDELLLNFDNLEWPLTLRKWKAGDKFSPMGLKGQKTVADFLTDHKVDLFEKEDTWLVETREGKIAGIVGFRPDERFKISKNAKLCLHLKRKSVYF